MIRKLVKNKKTKKDTDSLSIDLKKLKQESINNVNKREKIRPLIIGKIKTYNFNKRMRPRPVINTKIKINKKSSKNNVACTIKDSGIVDVCTSTDDLIVKKYVDTCTSTDDLIVKNQVDACTSTDDIIVKNQVNAFTSTDDIIVKS